MILSWQSPIRGFTCTSQKLTPWKCSKLCVSGKADAAGTSSTKDIEVGWLWQTPTQARASETRRVLRENRLRPKKSLGQNFVTDDDVLADIVRVSGISSGDIVIEVGPGTGNLTRHILETGAMLTAIEKDDELAKRLEAQHIGADNFRLVLGDVLKVGVADIISEVSEQARHPDDKLGVNRRRQVKVITNLPYNITKEFLQLMLPQGDHISEVSIMMQEEVARRLVNQVPGGQDYRAMNIFTHFYSRPKYHFKISRTKYFPEPAVDGALVTFHLLPSRKRPAVTTERSFFNMVNKAFSERRKMLRNSLQPLYSGSQVDTALRAMNLAAESRAQNLSLDQFVEFHHRLQEAVLQELAAHLPQLDPLADE